MQQVDSTPSYGAVRQSQSQTKCAAPIAWLSRLAIGTLVAIATGACAQDRPSLSESGQGAPLEAPALRRTIRRRASVAKSPPWMAWRPSTGPIEILRLPVILRTSGSS
jgi:hypothetical protein